MKQKPKVIILRTAGTNCDEETAFAFKKSGADVAAIHINKLLNNEVALDDFHILALPGGFTYGDDIESGRILANELQMYFKEHITNFLAKKKLIIGICNGFQVLVKAGILPGNKNNSFRQSATLTFNDCGKFEDRWVHLEVDGQGPWLKGIKELVYYPIAHAEGKFFVQDKSVLSAMKKNNQIAFRYSSTNGRPPVYPENPNGSLEDIAGITDESGRILGLMPHPERHYLFTQHPSWTRFKKRKKYGEGAQIFDNGVAYVKKTLLK